MTTEEIIVKVEDLRENGGPVERAYTYGGWSSFDRGYRRAIKDVLAFLDPPLCPCRHCGKPVILRDSSYPLGTSFYVHTSNESRNCFLQAAPREGEDQEIEAPDGKGKFGAVAVWND